MLRSLAPMTFHLMSSSFSNSTTPASFSIVSMFGCPCMHEKRRTILLEAFCAFELNSSL